MTQGGHPGRLEGKVAVITGAGTGIGAAAAQLFRAHGATVVGVGHVHPAHDVDLAITADVTDAEAVDDLYREVREAYGRIDVLFNNAGISPESDGSILETELETWNRVQQVNLTSIYLCCKYGIPHLLETGGGSVINTASFVALMGAATSQVSYTASKGGVLSMSRELGVQFARQGVRVNALCPGPVNTPLLEELAATDALEAQRRLVHIPLGRFAHAAEIANAALFLASDESSFITASSLVVDGGISSAYVTPL
jgi:NAD(P)-dependent dehydrogenase (short-subunit alcohol dehydrogenase family)